MHEERLNFSQQHELLDHRHARAATIIGAGSVGSQVACMLAKMGVPALTIWDGDTIESHNVPMSAYRAGDIGVRKVDALGELIAEQSGLRIEKIARMYAGEPLRGAVVASVDSMEARKAIWEAVKLDPAVDVLVDTRTAAELVSVFAVRPCDPEDIDFYERFLYPSSEAVRPMCGLHGIIFQSAIAASAACSGLTSWWTKGRTVRHFTMLTGSLEAFRG
jgi:hypothetical protein